MRNPFRSEAAAFRFVLVTVAASAATAVAALVGGTLPAIAVWLFVTSAVIAASIETRRGVPLPTAPAHRGGPAEWRVLVVAPTLASPLRRLANDVDGAQAEARARASAVVDSLRSPNFRATAVVGDDPIVAVADALRSFGGDEIVVLPGDDKLADRLRERYALPVVEA